MAAMMCCVAGILVTTFIFLMSGSAYLQAQGHTPEKIEGNDVLMTRHGEKFLSIDDGITWEKIQSKNNDNPSIPLPSIGEAVWEENIPVDSSPAALPNGLTLLGDGDILINGGTGSAGYMMKVDASGQRQWIQFYGPQDSLIYIFAGIERAPDLCTGQSEA